MVTGSKSSFNDSVHSLFNRMRACLDKKNVDYLEVDGVANVLEERVRAAGYAGGVLHTSAACTKYCMIPLSRNSPPPSPPWGIKEAEFE